MVQYVNAYLFAITSSRRFRKVGRSGMSMYCEDNNTSDCDGGAGEKKERNTKAEVVGSHQ